MHQFTSWLCLAATGFVVGMNPGFEFQPYNERQFSLPDFTTPNTAGNDTSLAGLTRTLWQRGVTKLFSRADCDPGQAPCGSNHCYDVDTHHCCPGGDNCAKSDDCVEGGGCCPAGMLRCGFKCYDPKVSTCCTSPSDVSLPCPQEGSCCAKTCCRPGALCGGDGWCSWPSTPTPTPTPSSSPTSRLSSPSTSSEPDEPEDPEEPEEPELPDSSSITSDVPPFTSSPDPSSTLSAGPSNNSTSELPSISSNIPSPSQNSSPATATTTSSSGASKYQLNVSENLGYFWVLLASILWI